MQELFIVATKERIDATVHSFLSSAQLFTFLKFISKNLTIYFFFLNID